MNIGRIGLGIAGAPSAAYSSTDGKARGRPPMALAAMAARESRRDGARP